MKKRQSISLSSILAFFAGLLNGLFFCILLVLGFALLSGCSALASLTTNNEGAGVSCTAVDVPVDFEPLRYDFIRVGVCSYLPVPSSSE